MASNTSYLDFDALDLIRNFYKTSVADKHITMSLVEFKDTYNLPKEAMNNQIADHIFMSEFLLHSKVNYMNLLAQLQDKKK